MHLRFVKRYGAVSQSYRHRIKNFAQRLMLTAAGLWNFYLMAALEKFIHQAALPHLSLISRQLYYFGRGEGDLD